MVVFLKTARPVQGKFDEALAWAKEIAAKNSKGRPVKVYVPRFGDLNTIMWVQEFASAGAAEEHFNDLRKESGFRATADKHKALFDTNSIHEAVYLEV